MWLQIFRPFSYTSLFWLVKCLTFESEKLDGVYIFTPGVGSLLAIKGWTTMQERGARGAVTEKLKEIFFL